MATAEEKEETVESLSKKLKVTERANKTLEKEVKRLNKELDKANEVVTSFSDDDKDAIANELEGLTQDEIIKSVVTDKQKDFALVGGKVYDVIRVQTARELINDIHKRFVDFDHTCLVIDRHGA